MTSNAEERSQRIASIRQQIANGTYETAERLERAIDGFMRAELGAQCGEQAGRPSKPR